MRYAADLHLHSRYSSAVSPNMTVENIAHWARRKGVDVIGTGDCLQPLWRTELESKLVPAEDGWFSLIPEIEENQMRQLPASLQKPVRFVLSTEVNCAAPGTGDFGGIHHLIYFPSFDTLRRFQEQISRTGDFTEGRPTVNLSSVRLLEIVTELGEGCRMAPAHVMNPFFSSLGSQHGERTLHDIFGGKVDCLLAAETGLTSTPPMCRRISSLDSLALFSCSDAHSLDNIGRESTLLETEAGYESMMAALGSRSGDGMVGTIKVPIQLARYYFNWCSRCERSFKTSECPNGHGPLATGSRDWIEQVADRDVPEYGSAPAPHRMLRPLRLILGAICQQNWKGREVAKHYDRLLRNLGSERFILTEADPDAIAAELTPQLASEILSQRDEGFHGRLVKIRQAEAPPDSQIPLL